MCFFECLITEFILLILVLSIFKVMLSVEEASISIPPVVWSDFTSCFARFSSQVLYAVRVCECVCARSFVSADVQKWRGDGFEA